MAADDGSGLLQQVVELTRSCWTEHFVALYAYGSYVRGEMDAWSDLDVCLVRKALDAARGEGQAWATKIGEAFNQRVDPVGLDASNMGQDATWDVAPLLRSLRENSRLLMGEDVRARIPEPAAHKLRLGVSWSALRWVRNLYSIPRERPLGPSLPPLSLSLDTEIRGGSVAWGTATAVVQLVRALAFIETGVFCEEKRLLREHFVRMGDAALAHHSSDLIALRQEAPRFGPLEQIPLRLQHLAEAIPRLTSRLLEGLAKHGLEDPSWEPDGPLYLPDGTLKRAKR
jgi:predicted nucleotidyltransferase